MTVVAQIEDLMRELDITLSELTEEDVINDYFNDNDPSLATTHQNEDTSKKASSHIPSIQITIPSHQEISMEKRLSQLRAQHESYRQSLYNPSQDLVLKQQQQLMLQQQLILQQQQHMAAYEARMASSSSSPLPPSPQAAPHLQTLQTSSNLSRAQSGKSSVGTPVTPDLTRSFTFSQPASSAARRSSGSDSDVQSVRSFGSAGMSGGGFFGKAGDTVSISDQAKSPTVKGVSPISSFFGFSRAKSAADSPASSKSKNHDGLVAGMEGAGLF
ncbi:hypothetical protein HDU78_011643 [Chytriomyces hyalinus]|nr:hypothetical protein HDU78_011643 [Chytriomyces hyalinus]